MSGTRRPAGPRWSRASLVSLAGVVLLLASSLGSLSAGAQGSSGWENVSTEPVLTGLRGPVDVALASDGTVWWNEYYTGNVSRHDPDNGSTEVRFHADPIENGVERGLVGLALDPDVTENGVFYVYYTVADPEDPEGGTNRLSRVDGGEETVLLTVPAYERHNGGRILFAPDGTMFVSTGDNERGMPAQDPGSRLGKVLHLHPDGQPADDTIEGYVYSIGHRNVYGLAYDERGQRLFATENNNAERDEVNVVEAGANYGWPHCAGTVEYDHERGRATDEPCEDPRFEDPIGEFYPDGTAAPTGAVFVDGHLYWAAWNGGEIHRMTNASDGWTDAVVYETPGRINDLELGPSGESLYYANWTGIHRVELPDAPSGPGTSASGDETGDGSGPGSGADDGTRAGSESGTPGPALGLVVATGLAAAIARGRR